MATGIQPRAKIGRRTYAVLLAAAGLIVGSIFLVGHTASVGPAATPSPDHRIPQPESSPVALEDGFETAPLGSDVTSYLEANWNATVSAETMSRASVRKEGDNHLIRVLYPRGGVGAASSGASWRAHLPLSDEATAVYRVRFDPDFDWTAGGKLPGLTGGDSPTGGNPSDKGFSARYMWQEDGGLTVYLYHAEQPDRYGQSFDLGQRFERGEWHTLEQHVKLNTAGQADGVLRVRVDGELVLDRADIRWRLDGDTWAIDSFYFSSFHGGTDESYQPDRDNHIDFDDVKITTVPRLAPPAPGGE